MSHRHTASETRTEPWREPATSNNDRAAHGNVTIIKTCTCGAVQRVDVNGRHTAAGEWYVPEDDAS